MFTQMIDSGLVGSTHFSGRGAARAEDAQGTPTQSHILPSIQVYKYTKMTNENYERLPFVVNLRGPSKRALPLSAPLL